MNGEGGGGVPRHVVTSPRTPPLQIPVYTEALLGDLLSLPRPWTLSALHELLTTSPVSQSARRIPARRPLVHWSDLSSQLGY